MKQLEEQPRIAFIIIIISDLKAIMIIMENPVSPLSKENKKFLLMEVEKYNA